MSDDKHLISLPERGEERYTILYGLYKSVGEKINGDIHIFAEANKLLLEPLTIRTWFRAKAKWNVMEGQAVKTPTGKIKSIKGQHHPIVRTKKKLATDNIDVIGEVNSFITSHAPKIFNWHKKYDPEERLPLFEKICARYENGIENLVKICGEFEVDFRTFYTWIDENTSYKKKWEEVEKKHMLTFIRVFKEFYKEKQLQQMFDDKETHWTINYKYVPGIDEKGKAKMIMVEESASKTIKPRKIDTSVQQVFIETMKDMYALASANEMIMAGDLENVPLEELLRMKDELLLEMDKEGGLDV